MNKYLSAVLLGLLLSVIPINAEVANDTIVKFVQLSDVQLTFSNRDDSRRLFKDSPELFADAIKQVNNIKGLNFVIFTGDMIDSPSENDLNKFIEQANKLNINWYPAFGNHDVSSGAKSNKKQLINLLKTSTKAMQNGQGYYIFYPHKDCAVIVLDATITNTTTNHGRIDQNQFDWLKQQLEQNKDKVVIIALHHPIVPPFEGSDHSMLEPSRTKLLNLINKYKNVALIITGHYHTAKIMQISNTVHASAPSIIEYPNAFRIITIKRNGDIVFDWKETTLKALQNKSKSRCKWTSTAYGTPKDRITTVNYKKDRVLLPTVPTKSLNVNNQ